MEGFYGCPWAEPSWFELVVPAKESIAFLKVRAGGEVVIVCCTLAAIS